MGSPPVWLVAASLELSALLIGSSALESPLLDQQLLTGYITVGPSLWVLWDFEFVESWGTPGIPHRGVFQLRANTYITCISYIYWTNALVPPPPISVMKHAEKRVYSETYLKNTSWGGAWSVRVLKQLGHIEFTPGKPRPVHAAAQLPSLHLCCLESQLGNGATQSGQVFPSISINTVKTTPPKACPEASLFSPHIEAIIQHSPNI